MNKTLRQFFLSVACVFVLVGCSSKSSNVYAPQYSATSGDTMSEEAGYSSMSKEEMDSSTVVTGDKLVYTGSITVETLKYQETVSAVRAKVKDYNGIIEYENEYDTNYSWYTYSSDSTGTRHLNLTVRIPTEKFYDFLSDMEGTGGKVRDRSSSVENISKRYNDNETEIEALQMQEKRLLEMMEQAETIEDMIAIETRLTEVQTQLNRNKSDKASMDMQVDYSTIDVYVDEVKEYRADQENTFGERLSNVFGSSWRGFVETMEDLLFFLIRLLPYLIIILPLGFLLKKFVPKRKKGKADNEVEQPKKQDDEKKIL